MIIRCPRCGHSRPINPESIPDSAELATCPKCQHRFRFRFLEQRSSVIPAHILPASSPADIWDAVDSRHRHWQSQLVGDMPGPGALPGGAPVTYFPDNGYGSGADAASPMAGTPENTAGSGIPTATEFFPRQISSSDAAPGKFFPGQSSNSGTVPAAVEAAPLSGLAFKAADNREKGVGAAVQTAAPTQPQAESSVPIASASLGEASFPSPFVVSASAETRAPADEGNGLPEPVPSVSYQNAVPGEERVDREPGMLRDEPERPSRNIGRREGPDSDASHAYPEGLPIPWEGDEQFGKIHPFVATIKGIMLDAAVLFRGVASGAPLAHAYLFFLLQAYIAIVCTMVWGQATRNFLQLDTTQARLALPVLLLMTPLALGVIQVFMAGWINALVRLTVPAKADFSRVFKMIGYAAAPFVLCIIPFVGPVAASAWFLVALVAACRHGLGLGWVASLCFPLPSGVLFIAGMSWCFL